MSRASAETSLALFDRMQGRGDVFSVSIEDGAGLAALDEKTFASILLPVFRWWATGAENKPSNTLALMMYERLKTHQLENAVRRGANLKNWLENAHKGGRPKDPEKTKRKPIGNQLETKRKPSGHSMEYEDSSCKLKTQVTSLQSCKLESSEGDNISRNGLTPSAHVAPSDEVPSDEDVKEARKFIEENAPEVTSLPCMKSPTGKPNKLCFDFLRYEDDQDRIELAYGELYAIELRDERGFPTAEAKPLFDRFIQPISKLYDEVPESCEATLTRALAKAYYVDRCGEDADDDADFILARMQKVAAAVTTLEAAKSQQSKKPLSDADY